MTRRWLMEMAIPCMACPAQNSHFFVPATPNDGSLVQPGCVHFSLFPVDVLEVDHPFRGINDPELMLLCPSYRGTKKREFCVGHAKEGMIDLMHINRRREKCMHPGYTSLPSFGVAGPRRRERVAGMGMTDDGETTWGTWVFFNRRTEPLAGAKTKPSKPKTRAAGEGDSGAAPSRERNQRSYRDAPADPDTMVRGAKTSCPHLANAGPCLAGRCSSISFLKVKPLHLEEDAAPVVKPCRYHAYISCVMDRHVRCYLT